MKEQSKRAMTEFAKKTENLEAENQIFQTKKVTEAEGR